MTVEQIKELFKGVGIEVTRVGYGGGNFGVTTTVTRNKLRSGLRELGISPDSVYKLDKGSYASIWTVYIERAIKERRIE